MGIEDVLKKPVHPGLVKPTKVRELYDEGKFPKTIGGTTLPEEAQKLPQPERKVRKKPLVPGLVKYEPLKQFNPVKDAQKVRRTAALRAKLRVIYESVPPFTEEETPPCSTCKAAPCCQMFLVPITELEYDSGVYGDVAVEVTPEMLKQMRGKLLRPFSMAHESDDAEKTFYYLEGRQGAACPFLGKDYRCTIYDQRPLTCRTYTCVGDSRITEEHRSGERPVLYSDEFAALPSKEKRALLINEADRLAGSEKTTRQYVEEYLEAREQQDD